MQSQESETGEHGQSRHCIYRIEVATGSDFGAGTDANVFCVLVGEQNRSSAEFPLDKSLLHVNKFERGQVGGYRLEILFAFFGSCSSRLMFSKCAGGLWVE